VAVFVNPGLGVSGLQNGMDLLTSGSWGHRGSCRAGRDLPRRAWAAKPDRSFW